MSSQINKYPDWLEQVAWNADGLVPVVAQEDGGRVLTQAWMNREALLRTVQEGLAVYWSRSRRKLWQKGETSGHTQRVREVRMDCDSDSLLLIVEQVGGIACHTGRHSCFYKVLGADGWRDQDPVLKSPEEIYGK